jgi:hypothetical protein
MEVRLISLLVRTFVWSCVSQTLHGVMLNVGWFIRFLLESLFRFVTHLFRVPLFQNQGQSSHCYVQIYYRSRHPGVEDPHFKAFFPHAF